MTMSISIKVNALRRAAKCCIMVVLQELPITIPFNDSVREGGAG